MFSENQFFNCVDNLSYNPFIQSATFNKNTSEKILNLFIKTFLISEISSYIHLNLIGSFLAIIDKSFDLKAVNVNSRSSFNNYFTNQYFFIKLFTLYTHTHTHPIIKIKNVKTSLIPEISKSWLEFVFFPFRPDLIK